MLRRTFLALAAGFAATAGYAADAPKKLLLVTHSGGFIHNSVGEAEKVLKEIGPKRGYEVTCFRYTGDPADPAFKDYQAKFKRATGVDVTPESCGRVNKETLKNYDAVLFFTTGSGPKHKNLAPLTETELDDLKAWVKAGGAFCGSHCASDTLYDTGYGELIGGYFKTHPPGLLPVKLHIDDPKHPAAVGFTEGQVYTDEIYVFTDSPYSRDKVKVLMSVAKGNFEENLDAIKKRNPNFDPTKSKRKDGDYAISWVKDYGQGKVFYTSLGHDKKVWNDEKYQTHLFAGIAWALGDKAPKAK
jgi:type 1 glutamine amidotransferase